MDILPESAYHDPSADAGSLSYDDTIPYAELPAPPSTNDAGQPSLADRIGQTKVYLISDVLARTGKVRAQTSLKAQ
jgi:hypothetical protein